MTTYAGKGMHAKVWRIVQEHRGRKELRKTRPAALDPKATPKGRPDRFADN